ncbi:MAG TPA: hypothetical protein VE871_18620 [Longimicrobium sp.]|nr:hypothetical protein [Longimicrobium sp.]
MRTLLGLVLFGLAFTLGLLVIMGLADPAGASMANDADPFGPVPPWYVPAAWLALALALLIAAIRLLNGGILGRLVRGRGLTPAEQ